MSELRALPLKSELEKIDFLELKVFPGVSGKDYKGDSNVFNHEAFFYLNGREPMDGEVGCALAHFAIYNDMLTKNLDWALVLEDDSRLAAGGLVGLATLFSIINSDNLLLETPTIIHLKLENRPVIVKKIVFGQKLKAYECLTVLREANSYLINRNAAKCAALAGLPLNDVADWPHWVSEVFFVALEEDVFFVDRQLESEIGLRKDMYEERGFTGTKLVLNKIRIIFMMLTGIEKYIYIKNTKLNDYYFWVVRNRLLRMLAKFVGKVEYRNDNVILVPWRSKKKLIESP